jgi:hypothetical protein
MKWAYWIGGALILLIIFIFILRGIGGEDSWIKDEKGVYVRHGNPAEVPENVMAQQTAITCAAGLYDAAKKVPMMFESQCLGTCGDFAVDIVNVPRDEMDNLEENQCADFRAGKLGHFIELDKNGETVRIG